VREFRGEEACVGVNEGMSEWRGTYAHRVHENEKEKMVTSTCL